MSNTQASFKPGYDLVNFAEEEVKALSTELSEYLSVYSAIEDEKVYSHILALVNRFLELVAPVSYYPELVQLISSRIELRLWEADIPAGLIESILLNTYRLKQALLSGAESELSVAKQDLSTALLDLYARLEATDLFDLLMNLERDGALVAVCDKLLSIAVLTIVVATNQ